MPLPLIPLAVAAGSLAIRAGSKKLAKHLIKQASKKVKKRNTTPKREYNKEQNPRQVAKEFKKITGESIKTLNDKPLYQTTGAKQFKLDYKKKDNVYRGMTPGQAVLIKNNSSHYATTKNILKKITVKKIK